MWKKLQSRIKTELRHFHVLPSDAKKILFSFIIYNAATALIIMFVNVFLWRKSDQNLNLIIAYNTAFSFTLPFSFIFNGYLLRRFSPKLMYWIGVFLQGLSYLLVVYLPINFLGTILNGILEGLGGGFFWANKNYLTLRYTKNTNRIYFNNIESVFTIIINLTIPLVAGWFISLSNSFSFYSLDVAYRILAALAFGLMVVSGRLVQTSSNLNINVKSIFHRQPSKAWQLNRLFSFFGNLIGGVSWFLPSIIMMTKITSEGVLGTVKSISSILVALLLYYMGRKTQFKHLLTIAIVANLLAFLNSSLLIFSFTSVGVLIYFFLSQPFGWLRFIPGYTISMELMDYELANEKVKDQYSLVVDNEIMFNLGRLVGIGLLVLILKLTSKEVAMKFSLAFFNLLSLGGVIALIKLKPYLKQINDSKATD